MIGDVTKALVVTDRFIKYAGITMWLKHANQVFLLTVSVELKSTLLFLKT